MSPRPNGGRPPNPSLGTAKHKGRTAKGASGARKDERGTRKPAAPIGK